MRAPGGAAGLRSGAVHEPREKRGGIRVRLGLAASVLLACAALLGAAGSAQAFSLGGTLDGVLGATGLPGTTAPNLSAVFDSPNLGNLLASVGCPIAKALPSPPVPNQVSQVVCALGVLDYAYRTVYVQPNGIKLTRITRALVGLPTLIDVNGDGLPDFIGTVLPSLSGLSLHIQRLAWFSRSAQVSVEAVALNPAAPGAFIGAGEDGLAAGTDVNWSATVTFVSLSTAASEIRVAQNNSSAPSTVATLGELFSGPSPDAPTDISRGDISFTPVPATLTTDVKLGQASQEAAVTSSAPSVVGAAVSLISPGDDKEIEATVNKLASSVDIAYTHPNSETKVTYSSGAPVTQLSAHYQDTAAGTLATAAALDATSVPTGLTVDQVGAQTAITTSGGPIGLVEARYGSGRDAPPAASGTGAYASYHGYSDGSLAAAVRLPNLQALTLNAAEPFSGDLVLTAPLSYIGLSGQDDSKGYNVTGHLSNLPQHTTVGIDLGSGGGGKVTFDGHGTGVDEIALDATDSQGTFFGRASRVQATIDNIPALDTINFDDSSSGQTTQTTASASQPIGTISLLASDGSEAPALTGSGVSYTDTPASFNAFARIDGLKGLSLSLTDDGSSLSALSGSIQTASQDPGCQGTGGQDLTLHAQTDSGTFDGALDSLPSSVSFNYGPNAAGDDVVDYQASAPIAKITADAKRFSSPIPGATTFHGEIDCLPSHLTLTIPKGDGNISFDTHGDHIDHILAQLYGSHGPATLQTGGFQPGGQLVYYDPSTSQVTLDLDQVGGFTASQGASPLALDYDVSSQKALDVEVIQGLLFFKAAIENPQPASFTMTPGDGNLQAQYTVNSASSNFSGDGHVNDIGLETNLGGQDWFEGSLSNVPAQLGLCLLYSSGTDCIPSWVEGDAADSGKSVPSDALFALDVVPSDLNGHVPSTPVTFTGSFCSNADRNECEDMPAGQTSVTGVTVTDLTFNILNLAVGQKTDDCTASVACGRAWATLNTGDEPVTPPENLTGQATYYEGGSPFISFNAPDPGGFVSADQFFYFAQYNVGISDSPLDTYQTGRLSCGSSPQPNLNIDVGVTLDLLSGTFGVCP